MDNTRYWKLTLDGDTAEYRPLVELPFSGFPNFTVNVMSRDGNVFGGRVADTQGVAQEAFVWSEEAGVVRLGRLLDGLLSEVSALSFDGSVAVGRAGTPQTHAFRWTEETGMVDLGDLPGGGNFSWARAVSNDGSVVVGDSSSANSGTSLTRSEAFRWTQEAGMVGLGDPNFPGFPGPSDIFSSRATVISGDGRLIGGQGVGGSFYTESEGWVPFGFGANAISFDGTYMVGTGNFGQGPEAFLWSEEQGILPLGELPGGQVWSEGLGVSDDGRIVVGTTQVPEPSGAAILVFGIAASASHRVRSRP
jgi:probable HAF family extracellular repeat protein